MVLPLQVRVQTSNGSFGVDDVPTSPARFTHSPLITSIAQNMGSVQGGRLLQLTSGAAAFNTTQPYNNRVSHQLLWQLR